MWSVKRTRVEKPQPNKHLDRRSVSVFDSLICEAKVEMLAPPNSLQRSSLVTILSLE